MRQDNATAFLRETLRVNAGLLIWAAHLGLVYGVTALACANRVPLGMAANRWIVAALTLLALGAAGWALAAALRRRAEDPLGRFLDFIAAAIAVAGLVGIAWGGLPAVLVPGCG